MEESLNKGSDDHGKRYNYSAGYVDLSRGWKSR